MESSNSTNTHMLHNTNKTNKKLFALFASSLLAVNLLTGCDDKKTDANDSPNNGVTVAEPNPNKPSQSSNPTQLSRPIAIQNPVSLADYTKPAVVQIASGCTAKVRFSYNDQSKIYDVSAGGSGSGFFINSDGYIVTNVHVIEAKTLKNAKKHCFKTMLSKLLKIWA